MSVNLLIQDIQIGLNAFLTVWGVPFHRTAKPQYDLRAKQLEQLTRKLRRRRNDAYSSATGVSRESRWATAMRKRTRLSLDKDELNALIAALQAVVREYHGRPVELATFVGKRTQVRRVLNALERARSA